MVLCLCKTLNHRVFYLNKFYLDHNEDFITKLNFF